MRSEDGMSLGAIAAELEVSKSSVSLWVRDIELTPQQEAALLEQNPARNGPAAGHAGPSQPLP